MILSWIPTFLFFFSILFTSQCSPSTNTIFTESGIGHSNTYHFIAESPWKLDWTAQGRGSLTVYAKELNGKDSLYIAGEHLSDVSYGSTWVYDISGPIYLQIGGSSSGNVWTVEVSQ